MTLIDIPTTPTKITTARLLSAGVVGAALWVVSFTVQGLLRPGYDPIRHYVSQLSLGPGGWVQVATFVATGVLMVGFAVGLRRVLAPGRASRWAPILFTIFGVGLIVAGIFPPDPGLGGFPTGSTIPADSPTTSFRIHILSAMAVFFSLPAACLVLARRFNADPATRGWTMYSVLTGIVVWGLWAASTVLSGDGSAPIDAVIGLMQRIYLVAGFSWIALLALRLRAALIR
jgi:hypothetical membrane protein